MRLHVITITLFILILSLFAQAQPDNDESCNAIYIGHLDEENRYFSITGNNIGATVDGETGGDEPDGFVLDVAGSFSCLGTNPWRNTVWYYFTYDYPFHKLFFTQLTSTSGTFNYVEMLSENLCPIVRNQNNENVYASSSCGLATNQSDFHGYCIPETEYARFPRSIPGTIYIMVSSNSDAEEGEFELEVFLPEPTYCNDCQDQNETVQDGPFTIDNLSKIDENAGSANGSITIDGVTGGKQVLTYSIDGTNFQNETVFENLSAGTYIVTVKDANDCITTQQITIEQLLPESPTITPPEIACEGEQQTVSATGQNISWYSDAALTQQVGTGNEFTFTAGEYTQLFATQTVNGFVSPSTSVSISFIALPEVTINAEGDECSATLTAVLNPNNNSATYQWLKDGVEIDGATSNSTNSIGAGSYQVRVTISDCVILSEPYEVTGNIPSKPVIEEPLIYCEGDIIQALTAESNGEIRWYADESLTQELASGNTFTPTNLTTTTIFYVQSTLGICTSEVESVTVQVSPLPSAEINVTTPCVGNILTAASNQQNVSFQWLKDNIEIDAATNADFTPQEVGEYQVRVSKDGCSSLSATISILEIPEQPVIQSETMFCNNVASITLEASSNFEIFWYSDVSLTQQVNQGNTFTTSNISSQIFYLQAQNGVCVSEVTQLIVTIKPTPIVTLMADRNNCVGEPLIVNVSNEAASIEWFLNGNLIPNENGLEFTPQSEGIYTASATLVGCTGISNELSIDEFPTKPVVESIPFYCLGDEITPITAMSSGDLRWYADQALTQEVGSGESFQPSGLTTSTTFWVQAANNNCLSDTTGFTITINPVPTASINPQTTLCIGEPLEAITENPTAVSYQWLLDGAVISGATESTFITQQSGAFQVQISSGGCITTSEAVQINDIPNANAGLDQVVCLGEPVTLLTKRTSQTNIYEWFDVNGNSISNETEFEVNPTDTTFYIVQLTDANGCSTSDTVDIFVDTTPIEAGFSIPFTIGYAPLEITFTDQSIAADTVLWDFDDGNTSTERSPTYIFEEVGEYEVLQQVSANDICFRDSIILIRVVEPLNIPNGISPNGDGSNDIWIIENINLFPENNIKVFNQWGNLVYEASNYQNDWSGDQLPDATYFFVISLGGNIPDIRGYLVILR